MNSRILLLAVIILVIPLCACNPPDTVTVTRVIDGDTIEIGTGQRVRYIGIDAPEIHPEMEAYGVEAWEANRRMVEGKKVRLERDVSDTDKYGRLLRYVFIDDKFVNAELVRLGMARAKVYPPDTIYQKLFEQLEKGAREAGWGMWAE